MTKDMLDLKVARVDHANALIEAISRHGRRFFFDKASGRVARLQLDPRGRVWFVDDYSGKAIYTHKTSFGNRWRGFSHGGTLRSLVESMRDYIVAGTPISCWVIAPTYLQREGEDMWGYGPQARDAIRKEALVLPIIKPGIP